MLASGAPGARGPRPLDGLLDELALAHRVLAMEGHSFATVGSVSLRDPDGRGFWTKRSGIGMDEVYGPAEMVLVDFAGQRVAGSGGPVMEWPLRSAIFDARSDANAVVFAPCFYATVFSATGRPVLPTRDEGRHFEFNVPNFARWTGRFHDPAVARQVAAELDDAKAILLKNNGVVTVGESVPVAVLRTIFLEKACQLQLSAESAHEEWDWVRSDSENRSAGKLLRRPGQVDDFWQFYLRRLARLESGAPLAGERR